MRAHVRANLLLVGKSILVVVGFLLAVSAAVELKADGWSRRAGLVLALGLLLVVPPIGFAFADAVKAARRGER